MLSISAVSQLKRCRLFVLFALGCSVTIGVAAQDETPKIVEVDKVIHSASFDCAKAVTKVELLICNDRQLSELDEEMARAYGEALKKFKNVNHVREQQRRWLVEVRNHCLNAQCLRMTYQRRISQLVGTRIFSPDVCLELPSTPTIGYCLGSQMEDEKQHMSNLIEALIYSKNLEDAQISLFKNKQAVWEKNLRCHCYDEADRTYGQGTGWSIGVSECELKGTKIRVTEIVHMFSVIGTDYGGNNPRSCAAIEKNRRNKSAETKPN